MTGPLILSAEDLNLTERAARAAGFDVQRFRARDLVVIQIREPGGQWRQFDPLNDDAETFRLMVDCDVPPSRGTTAIIAAGGVVEQSWRTIRTGAPRAAGQSCGPWPRTLGRVADEHGSDLPRLCDRRYGGGGRAARMGNGALIWLATRRPASHTAKPGMLVD